MKVLNEPTKEELDEAMEEWECVKVDEHLKTCPKHKIKMKELAIKDLMKWINKELRAHE